MALQPAEMDNCTVAERQPGFPEPSINGCTVCKFQHQDVLGQLSEAGARGGAYTEWVSARLALLPSTSLRVMGDGQFRLRKPWRGMVPSFGAWL